MLSPVASPDRSIQVADQLQVDAEGAHECREWKDRRVFAVVHHAPQETLQSYVADYQ